MQTTLSKLFIKFSDIEDLVSCSNNFVSNLIIINYKAYENRAIKDAFFTTN